MIRYGSPSVPVASEQSGCEPGSQGWPGVGSAAAGVLGSGVAVGVAVAVGASSPPVAPSGPGVLAEAAVGLAAPPDVGSPPPQPASALTRSSATAARPTRSP